MQVAVIPADPDQPIRFEDIEITLDAMQGLVGGYIEAVGLGRNEMTMYVNEEGKLQALPHNLRATLIARGAGPISPSDWIAGDAVLTGAMDDEGNDTAVTEEQALELRLFGEDFQKALAARHARAGAQKPGEGH